MLSFHPDYLLISITAKKVSLVIGTGGAIMANYQKILRNRTL